MKKLQIARITAGIISDNSSLYINLGTTTESVSPSFWWIAKVHSGYHQQYQRGEYIVASSQHRGNDSRRQDTPMQMAVLSGPATEEFIEQVSTGLCDYRLLGHGCIGRNS